MMALTIAGCGDWDRVDPAITAAKELGGGAPVEVDKLAGGSGGPAPTVTIVDKNSDTGVPTGGSGTITTTIDTGGGAPAPAPAPSAGDGGGSGGGSGDAGGSGSDAGAPVAGEGSQSTPPPTPAPAPAATLNSVDTILADMQLMNDLPLLNVNPAYGWAHGPGYVLMGNDPRGINTPAWWQASNPSLVNGNYLTHLLPWAVQFEGVGNSASNTRIHIRNLKAYVLSRRDGVWRQTHSDDILGGNFCPQNGNYYGCSTGAQQRAEPDGGHSFKPLPGMNFHGYFGGRRAIDGPDVHAVFVTFQARLVVDNTQAGDDRANARYLIHVGADYYPGDHSTVLMPAVSLSRAKRLTSQWQAFNTITVEGAGIHEPGGGLPMAQFLSNPPPME